MDEIQALMLSLRRCWIDIMNMEKAIAERDQKIKTLEDQLRSVSQEA